MANLDNYKNKIPYLNALVIMPSFTFFVGNHRYVNHLKDTGPFDLKADEKMYIIIPRIPNPQKKNFTKNVLFPGVAKCLFYENKQLQ